jgi:hypothetical protein
MKINRKNILLQSWRILSLGFFALLGFTGCNNNTLIRINMQAEPLPESQETLLFVLHAKKGQLTVNSVNTNQGKLILSNVDRSIAYFTDRPVRKAGKMSMQKFIKSWSADNGLGFGEEPPNSGFVFYKDPKNGPSEVNIELLEPKYDQKAGTLSFDITFLDDDHPSVSTSLTEPVLYIDASAPLGGGSLSDEAEAFAIR